MLVCNIFYQLSNLVRCLDFCGERSTNPPIAFAIGTATAKSNNINNIELLMLTYKLNSEYFINLFKSHIKTIQNIV